MKQLVVRKAGLAIMDMIGMSVAITLALLIHYEGILPREIIIAYAGWVLLISMLKIAIYRWFGLYASVWEYASVDELMQVIIGVTVGNLMGIGILYVIGYDGYLGVYVIASMFELFFVGGSRMAYRMVRRIKSKVTRHAITEYVLIIGSGFSARLLATELRTQGTLPTVVGYIDNNPKVLYQSIGGLKVLGNYHDIYSVCQRFEVDQVVIAESDISSTELKLLIDECKHAEVRVKILPSIYEMMDGVKVIDQIRDVEIEDLLGRDPVDLDVQSVASYIEDKCVMITGGGGSIGSEICRQIARFAPSQLVIVDIYENNAYAIQNELKFKFPQLDLDVIIASVRDRENIFQLMDEVRPHVVFHAAAHKHVPLMERTPREAILNNVFGTMNVAEAADKAGVSRFVLISTDKAVNPTNVMGASKRMCEMIIQGLNQVSQTTFAAVRFGNVLGSNGSVIPLFKSQIKRGGPVTVTHKEIIRYFMTIPEAAQLVIQAGAIAKGGEIFVLDMGEAVKIYDLAMDLIRLSGYVPNQDMDIVVTGLRPGEKLYEELLMAEEGLVDTGYEKIHIGKLADIDYKVLKHNFKALEKTMTPYNSEAFVEMLEHIVPTYKRPVKKKLEQEAELKAIAKKAAAD